MILANSDMISWYPAQLYYSVLPLLPSDTYLAHQYPTPRGCISVVTGRENSWSPLLFTLPEADVAAFAPGGHVVAVASRDKGMQIYNASNGLLNSSIGRISSTDDDEPHLAAFTEDGSEVVVVSLTHHLFGYTHRVAKFNLVKQSGRIWRSIPRDDGPYHALALSEYGSYVAFSEHKNGNIRICIWKTDGSDDISIPLRCGQVQDLDLAGEQVHLVAVAAKDITILSIASGAVQRTLYAQGHHTVRISRDGSFLASLGIRDAIREARLWSITQGTLLATFDVGLSPIGFLFSRTN